MWPVPRSAAEGPNGANSTLDIGGRAGIEDRLPLVQAHVGVYHASEEGLKQRISQTVEQVQSISMEEPLQPHLRVSPNGTTHTHLHNDAFTCILSSQSS